ncbi:MAG: thioredoxin-dependent thiol peroxidase [Bacteroidia bacterium]
MSTTLKAGDKAPDFRAINQNEQEISLADFTGKKLVLYFYPKDNTPTCTTEACNLRDNFSELKAAGYQVLGVSPDSAKKHTNFINKHELPFDLLVDNEHKLHEAYGVWGEKKMYGKTYMGTIRTTFLINEAGQIEKVIDKVKAKEHHNQILG